MAEPKTQRNDASVIDFLNGVPDDTKRKDCFQLLALIQEITGEEPAMWGSSIVGYGTCRYKYASGKDAEWLLTGFSPRKQNLTVYIMPGFDAYGPLLAKLGKHKIGKSCLYINKLADVDMATLRELISQSVTHIAAITGGDASS